MRSLTKIAVRAFVVGAISVACFLLGQISLTTTIASDVAGLGGRILFHTDSPLVGQDTGSALLYWSGLYPVTKPPAFGTWTQVNFGTSTVDQNSGGIYINPTPSASTSLRILALPIPSTPYTLTARIRFASNKVGGGHTLLGWRQSSSGKLVTIGVGTDNTAGGAFYGFTKWTNPTLWSANYTVSYHTGAGQNVQYLRITDSGANLSVFISLDGFHWQQFGATQTRTEFMLSTGPDQYIFECDSNDAALGAQCTLESLVQQ
jgi:hypothetical protein